MTGRARVLVVEDDDEIRGFVTMALAEEGYDIQEASHGAAALALLTGPDAVQPHLILLDLRMPVMDGWAFAAAYRQLQLAGDHAAIVAVTATRDVSDSAAQVQADAVLAKPFDLDALLDVVARYASR
jgi:CheY-like chemotaxis protein